MRYPRGREWRQKEAQDQVLRSPNIQRSGGEGVSFDYLPKIQLENHLLYIYICICIYVYIYLYLGAGTQIYLILPGAKFYHCFVCAFPLTLISPASSLSICMPLSPKNQLWHASLLFVSYFLFCCSVAQLCLILCNPMD